MKEATIITLGRMACGTAILITHAATGYDGIMLSIALLLLGVPIERFKRDKKE